MMKIKKNHITRKNQYSFIKLYLEDFNRIFDLLSRLNSKIIVETEEAIYENIDELANDHPHTEKFEKLSLSTKENSYQDEIKVWFWKSIVIIETSSSNQDIVYIYNKIDLFLRTKTSKVLSHLSKNLLAYNLSFIFLSLISTISKSFIIIGASIAAIQIILMVWLIISYISPTSYYLKISESVSFWKKNKEIIWVSVIGSTISGLIVLIISQLIFRI